MTSRKARRYGQGGFKHKKTPNTDRPNGKAWKKFPKAFSLVSRSLLTGSQVTKGTTDDYI